MPRPCSLDLRMRLPPLGLAAMLPVSFKRCIHLIAELAPTSTHSAASRRDAPGPTQQCPCSRRPRS